MEVALLPCTPALLGAGTEWPLSGHFVGRRLQGEVFLAWAGRVGAGEGPERGWRASRTLSAALYGDPPPDRLHALGWFWDRVAEVTPASLGETAGTDLVVLVVAGDTAGFAVSAVGLGHLYGTLEGYLRAWIVPPHPLLGPPGLPASRPGALQVHRAPAILVGAADGAPSLEHERVEPVLPWCGVHR